jgi:hypothetical protein
MGWVREERLPGGFVTSVVRVGDTVRRRPPEGPEFTHALLGWFEQSGWDGAGRADVRPGDDAHLERPPPAGASVMPAHP